MISNILLKNFSSVKKTTQLKNLIQTKDLSFIMEAHNGLSAAIVEETGFKGIWASGLSISAQLGVRDSNEASYTQVLDVCEFMSDRTTIPILLDGDTGYGNYNNARRLIKKLEQRNVAGVCLEDKIFPKRNSLLADGRQELEDVKIFSDKIRACKDTQQCSDFQVVARVEAFIAGWGLEEALKRSEAYTNAGADAILMHSAKSNPEEIASFMKEWKGRSPVIIVPTKYYKTPTNTFRDWGVNMVIWANHNMRAAVTIMQEVSKEIYEKETLVGVESRVVSVNEIFRIQGEEELKQADKKYL